MYYPKLKNKPAWVLDLQAGASAMNLSLEFWSKNSLLVELLGRGSPLEPWHSREGALAPPASLWGALNALSSQTEVIRKPRPAWLLGFFVAFMSQLSLHCTTAQQGQACANWELHPSGVKMFGVGNILCKAEINVQAAGGGQLWLIYCALFQIALALQHCHSLNIAHRDLKPENLLFKDNSLVRWTFAAEFCKMAQGWLSE